MMELDVDVAGSRSSWYARWVDSGRYLKFPSPCAEDWLDPQVSQIPHKISVQSDVNHHRKIEPLNFTGSFA